MNTYTRPHRARVRCVVVLEPHHVQLSRCIAAQSPTVVVIIIHELQATQKCSTEQKHDF